jgi:cystathionine beta-lyase
VNYAFTGQKSIEGSTNTYTAAYDGSGGLHNIFWNNAVAVGKHVAMGLRANFIFGSSTTYFKLAESLGGVKSLICHPAQMTHKSVPVEKRHRAGVADSLIRLSCGIEEAEDLIDDLKQAFKKNKNKREVAAVLK